MTHLTGIETAHPGTSALLTAPDLAALLLDRRLAWAALILVLEAAVRNREPADRLADRLRAAMELVVFQD